MLEAGRLPLANERKLPRHGGRVGDQLEYVGSLHENGSHPPRHIAVQARCPLACSFPIR